MAPRRDHPITSLASQVRLAALLVLSPGTGLLFLRVLATTWTRFFLPQYRPWRTGRVRKVAMALDAGFGFDASWYPTYMGFTRLWTGSLGWLHRRYGSRALPDIRAFLLGLESIFVEAHKVYSRCQSTVSESRVRPKGTPLAIRLFDPNLHCFPSTHVMIVGYNAWKLAGILDRLKAPGEDHADVKEFLLDEARRVVESIIHVKQHSLGDIAPALVLLDSMGFGPSRQGILDFLAGLFPHLPAARRDAVRAFLKGAYDTLETRRQAGAQVIPLLVAFLEDYEREIRRIAAEGVREASPASDHAGSQVDSRAVPNLF
jgi:hypothetical protein